MVLDVTGVLATTVWENRMRNLEMRKKKSMSFLPPWEFQTPLSLGTLDSLSTCLGTDSLTAMFILTYFFSENLLLFSGLS